MTVPAKDVVRGLATKSEKIRALATAGLTRTQIAAFLGIRYQHVRNVLVQSGNFQEKAKAAGTSLEPDETWTIDRLVEGGFEHLCECELDTAGGFGFSQKGSAKPGVYAFAVNGIVTYVGVSQSGLQGTMYHYSYGHKGHKTRARVKQLILESLANGDAVSFLVAHPPELDWNELPIDGLAGLEAGLIRAIRPVWNIQGKR